MKKLSIRSPCFRDHEDARTPSIQSLRIAQATNKKEALMKGTLDTAGGNDENQARPYRSRMEVP